jgi:hypothetical protein
MGKMGGGKDDSIKFDLYYTANLEVTTSAAMTFGVAIAPSIMYNATYLADMFMLYTVDAVSFTVDTSGLARLYGSTMVDTPQVATGFFQGAGPAGQTYADLLAGTTGRMEQVDQAHTQIKRRFSGLRCWAPAGDLTVSSTDWQPTAEWGNINWGNFYLSTRKASDKAVTIPYRMIMHCRFKWRKDVA